MTDTETSLPGTWTQTGLASRGWSRNGQTFETVYDVVCSDGLQPDAKTHTCPNNQAAVNLTDCSVPASKGASELSTTWSDPEFDPSDRAFYYARVLENPSCRWSSYAALAAHQSLPKKLPATIQERAWSSPVWYDPAAH